MQLFKKEFDDRKVKKIIYTAVFAVLALWFIYRFVMVAIESHRFVYNPARDAEAAGIPVKTMVAKRTDGFINIPVDIKKGRAYLSPARLARVRVGQTIGDGRVTYVSGSLDFDTGMYIIKTSGVKDGVHNILSKMNCFFVPAYAVRSGTIMVVKEGVASVRTVEVLSQDQENACIGSGLSDGDKVILSVVSDGQKLKVQQGE